MDADEKTLTVPQRAQQRDYRRHFMSKDLLSEATVTRHILAMSDESAPRTLPRLPAHAGQIVKLPADRLAELREAYPDVADELTDDGIYINFKGDFEITPYVLPQVDPIRGTAVLHRVAPAVAAVGRADARRATDRHASGAGWGGPGSAA